MIRIGSINRLLLSGLDSFDSGAGVGTGWSCPGLLDEYVSTTYIIHFISNDSRTWRVRSNRNVKSKALLYEWIRDDHYCSSINILYFNCFSTNDWTLLLTSVNYKIWTLAVFLIAMCMMIMKIARITDSNKHSVETMKRHIKQYFPIKRQDEGVSPVIPAPQNRAGK